MQQTIYHITSAQQWQQAQQQGVYRDPSLNSEGFIHCSTAAQVEKVANLFFAGQTHLLLLQIASDRLQSELRYDPVGEEQFPHVYGEINLDAIDRVFEFEPDSQGQFHLPAGLG